MLHLGVLGRAPGRRAALLRRAVAPPLKATKREKSVILLLERYLKLLRHPEAEMRWK